MPGAVVRLLLGGQVQDSPFLLALGRLLVRRDATLRRVGPALEIRIAGAAGGNPSAQRKSAVSLVKRAARAARVPVEVVSARVEDDGALAPGVRFLPPALGSSESLRATPAPGSDLAPCPSCAREFQRAPRRRGFIRTECLACGPRYSHAAAFPMTRASHGLSAVPPCGACEREAREAGSRRFASERIACGVCGPTPTLLPPSGAPFVRSPLQRGADRLLAGQVVAASTPYGCLALVGVQHVPALRVEIGSEFAPLGLLVASPAQARRFAALAEREARALFGPRAPELLVRPTPRAEALARELSVFGSSLRLRAPDSPVLLALLARAGPLVWAPASRGGLHLPRGAREGAGLPTAHWLTDGDVPGDPVPPARGYFLGARFALLSHGRGSLPARAPAGHERTVLAFGGGAELFGATAFGGDAYLTGGAGPSARADSGDRLRSLLSKAAALSPAVAAASIDLVAASAEEGTPGRLAAEEAAAGAGCPVVALSSAAARGSAAKLPPARGRAAALVLASDEPAAEGDGWLKATRTGGEVFDDRATRVLGGIAPFEIVEAPAGHKDLAAPLASLMDYASAPSASASADDAAILEVLRARAQRSTSFVLLVDGVAAALGLVPRRAPRGSGVAEVGCLLDRPSFAGRYPFAPALVSARGSRQLDAAALVQDLSAHWAGSIRREGHALAWSRRAALGASFTRALLDGLAKSARAAVGRGARIALSGDAFASPQVLACAAERLAAAGLKPDFPDEIPLLDGALPLGQVRLCAHA